MEDLLTLRPDELVSRKAFEILTEPHPDYRVSIYEKPKQRHIYGGGVDTGLGIKGQDRDTFIILDREQFPYRQVAEVSGHLGENLHKIVYGLCRYYFSNVFLVVERATLGLALLRTLRDEYGYGWVYYEEKMDEASNKKTRKLGYSKNKGVSDPIMTGLRMGIAEGKIDIYSPELVSELSRCQFKAKNTIEAEEAVNSDMKVKVAGGKSPDLMMGLAYAYKAVCDVAAFPKPKPVYKHGTMGDILGHDEIEVKPAHKEPQTPAKNPRDRPRPRPLVNLADRR